ncbi:hypothetical protein MNAB215_836 [Mycobacterium numidiamassiliense]|uniref:Transmembrane protein n=1 Tax=Mycobacterium numidiamassiliense TaxID=1841861 RepID=A0A2U3P4K0_9MYCO|nr:hypothetical protein [Mycobacterium numidiamassiliense]SPM38659.1 hypothetical protein MNAB215_836 [Mycobacterium numidiamassiliense]
MMVDPIPDQYPQPNWRKTAWYNAVATSVGSIVLSWDFWLGIIVGTAIAAGPTYSPRVADATAAILGGVSAVAATLTSLVLMAMTILVGVFGPAYVRLLNQLPRGLRGAIRPYLIVIVVSVFTSLAALALCILWPLVLKLPHGAVWALTAVPFIGFAYALFGCVQVVEQLISHVENNNKANQLSEARNAAERKRAAG